MFFGPTFVFVHAGADADADADAALTAGIGLRFKVDVVDRNRERRRRRTDELLGEVEIRVLLLAQQVRTFRSLVDDADNHVVVGALDGSGGTLVAEI